MVKFKLSFYQTLGLMTSSIGSMINGLSSNPVGMILVVFGIFLFITEFKLGWWILSASSVLIIGALFKIMHWPYSSIVILCGLICLLVVIFFRFIYREYKIYSILLYIASFFLTTGFLLKIMHFKFGNESVFAGFILIIAGYSVRFAQKDNKNFEDYNKLTLAILWPIASILKIYHWPWADVFSVISLVALWIWLVTSLGREMRAKPKM